MAPDQVVRLAPGGGSLAPFEALRARWIQALGALPSPAAASLAPAVLLGDTSGVTAEQSDLFVRTGTRHLLAVSGANVSQLALLASLPAWLASRATGRRWRWARPLAALVLLLYIPFAGGGSPVKRAAIAFALASLAPLLPARGGARGRRADPLSLLASAFLLEGLVNPRGLGALGTQLSYAATLGLVLFARPFARALARGMGARALAHGLGSSAAPRRAGSPPGWPRLVAVRAARVAALALSASFAAVLATLPIGWAHFGEWCPAGIVLTPLALPLVAWLLGAAAVHVLAPIAAPAGAVALPAELLVGLLELGDALPGTPSPLPWRPAWTLVLAAGLTLAAGAAGAAGKGASSAPAAARAAALRVGPLDRALARGARRARARRPRRRPRDSRGAARPGARHVGLRRGLPRPARRGAARARTLARHLGGRRPDRVPQPRRPRPRLGARLAGRALPPRALGRCASRTLA